MPGRQTRRGKRETHGSLGTKQAGTSRVCGGGEEAGNGLPTMSRVRMSRRESRGVPHQKTNTSVWAGAKPRRPVPPGGGPG